MVVLIIYESPADGSQALLWVAGSTVGKIETRGGRADMCRIQMSSILDRFRGFFLASRTFIFMWNECQAAGWTHRSRTQKKYLGSFYSEFI